MKQKLLNSFTWRGTLLVALLSCAFTSAWAQDWNKTDVIWDDNNNPNGTTISSNDDNTFTTTVNGFLKRIEVDCSIKKGGKNPKAKVVITVTDDNSQTVTLTHDNHTTSYSASGTYSSSKSISVKVTNQNNQPMTVSSITVTYTPAAIIPINAEFEGNFYGTYSNDANAFVVPSDFTVSKVSVSENGILSVNSLSGVVPAGTGVLVSSTSSGNKAVKLADPNGSYNPVSGNMLHPSSEAMTSIENYSESYFYHLTFDGNNLGFYWGAQDGGDWTFSGSNKAYLAVPKTDSGYSAVKGFTMSDSADGIKAIETEKNSEMVFNLAGQRVSKMQKGIYVVNGKKILVK